MPKTALLRFFLTYYGLIGSKYALPKNVLTNKTSLLKLLWNVIVTSTVIYGLICHDPFRMKTIFLVPCVANSISRPLFSTFARFSFTYAYPFVYLIYPVIGLINGRRIRAQLDCEHFRNFYHSRRQAVVIFTFVFIVNHFFLLTVIVERYEIHRFLGSRWPTRTDLIEWTALYVAFQYIYWLLHVVHYYQWATHRILANLKLRIQTKIKSDIDKETETEVLTTIRSLATVNETLNKLLSPLLIIYVFFLVFNFIFVACLLTMCSLKFRTYIHFYGISLYSCYIVLLNGVIQRTVAEILANLQKAHAQEECRILMKRKSYSRKESESLLERVASRRIDVLECDLLYRRHFAGHVFQMTTVDVRFLFKTWLFIAAYVVFIMQTN